MSHTREIIKQRPMITVTDTNKQNKEKSYPRSISLIQNRALSLDPRCQPKLSLRVVHPSRPPPPPKVAEIPEPLDGAVAPSES